MDFPVHLFSPYDTLITDIHTRLMYLPELYPGLDRTKSADRRVVKSGVWGLLLERSDAAFVHGLADVGASKDELRTHFCPVSERGPWLVTSSGIGGGGGGANGDDADIECPVVADLVGFFHGWNAHTSKAWFRAIGAALGGCVADRPSYFVIVFHCVQMSLFCQILTHVTRTLLGCLRSRTSFGLNECAQVPLAW